MNQTVCPFKPLPNNSYQMSTVPLLLEEAGECRENDNDDLLKYPRIRGEKCI